MEWVRQNVWRNTQLLVWLVAIGVVVIGSLSFALGMQRAIVAGTLLFISVAFHEAAHGVTAQLSGASVKSIQCSIVGPHVVRSRSNSPYVELAIAAAGPLANLLLCLCLVSSRSPMLAWTGLANFLLAIVNLLPFKNSDGRKILAALAVVVKSRAHA